MYGLTRAGTTLIGAGVAGVLVWLATQVDRDTNSGYWSFVGLLAAAGLVLALSQLLGGWTKWGLPRVSAHVFLLAFVPSLVVGGWVLLAAQPDSNWFGDTAENWAGDVGLGGVLEDVAELVGALAVGLGALFGFTFDTTGPRIRRAAPAVQTADERLADEPLTAERTAREPEFAGGDTGTRDRRVEIREGEPVGRDGETTGRRGR